MNKIFHITEVYIYSTRKKERKKRIIYKWTSSKVYISLILNNVGRYLNAFFMVYPPGVFCIFDHFPTVTVWFWHLSFDTEDNWRTQTLQTFIGGQKGNTMYRMIRVNCFHFVLWETCLEHQWMFTAFDHPDNNTHVYKLLNRLFRLNSDIIWSCGMHVNICYVK